MQLILTNYGHRLALQKGETISGGRLYRGDAADRMQIDRGLAQVADLDEEAIQLRYQRNPLEHIERLVFEYTTRCDFGCQHCRNAFVPRRTESSTEALKDAANVAMAVGINRFDFIGGEVTKHGNGWLEVVDHLKERAEVIAVVTNGWFLEERNFEAAGERYVDDREYLSELAHRGVTHVIFSLDGPEEIHDHWRSHPGLYQRILRGFDKAHATGMAPRVSLVLGKSGIDEEEQQRWLADLVARIYALPDNSPNEDKAEVLQDDKTNYLSNFIDIGGGSRLRQAVYGIDQMSERLLRCKNMYRPHPSLRIMASGAVSLCPLLDAGEGFGNIHDGGLLPILNHLQDAFVYRLHAEQRIGSYRKYLDTSVFSYFMEHVCTLRAILTVLAREMEERKIDPNDQRAVRALNEEIARRAGSLQR